jgi:hypothetical protein
LHVPYAAHYAQVLGVEKERAVWLLHEVDRMARNFEQMIHEFDAEGHATYTDDSALGLPLASESDIPRLPVMLVEPKRVLGVQEEGGGFIMELEAAIQAGMHRFNYGVAVLRPALGWKLRPTPSGVDLVDDQGGGWAHCPMDVDQEWVESAMAVGTVLVLYGPRLGVRRPPGHRGPYGQAEKRRELIEARKSGIVVAGFVEWGRTDQWIAPPEGPGYRPYADAMPDGIRRLRKGQTVEPTLSAAMPYFALRLSGFPQAALTVEPIAELEAPRCEVQADFELLK